MAGDEMRVAGWGGEQRKNKWYFKPPPCQWEDIHHFVRSQHVSHPSNPSLCRTFVEHNVGEKSARPSAFYTRPSYRHADSGRIITLVDVTSQYWRQWMNKENTKVTERVDFRLSPWNEYCFFGFGGFARCARWIYWRCFEKRCGFRLHFWLMTSEDGTPQRFLKRLQ
jgi:hypothetical protein